MPAIYPYTVTNSYKGGLFMRTYGRNVRRAWDGDDYRAPKRQRLDHAYSSNISSLAHNNNENASNLYDPEDHLERAIRETSVAALSSSPSRKNSMACSWHEHEEHERVVTTLTPPSSPPPALHVTPPNIKARKPTFSYMEKKKKEKEKMKAVKRKSDAHPSIASITHLRDDSEPLSEIMNSSTRTASQAGQTAQSTKSQLQYHSLHAQDSQQSTDRPSGTTQFKPPTLQKSMTQTVLDFGQSLDPVTCSQCQMSYTPSVPEDSQLHNMYHNRHNSGIELGKGFTKSAMKWCYEVPHIPGSVVVVDRKISIPGRRVVQRVLEVVNKELGSVDITEADLWSQKSLDALDGDETGDESAKKVDRYKAFLHIVDGKCVGVCLAERIAKGYRVKRVTSTATTKSTLAGSGADDRHNLRQTVSPDSRADASNEEKVAQNEPGARVAGEESKEENEEDEEAAHSMPTPTSTTITLTRSGQSETQTPPTTAGTNTTTTTTTPESHTTGLPTAQSSMISASSSSSSSSADLVIDEEASPAIVGVSRVWTSKTYRRKGIAANLLDCVVNQFIYGLEVTRNEVAFSQPTELGVGLARGWYGAKEGWLVYHES